VAAQSEGHQGIGEELDDEYVDECGRLLSIALDFDQETLAGIEVEEARSNVGSKFEHSSDEVKSAIAILEPRRQTFGSVSLQIHELRIGMLIDQDVRSLGGTMIVAQGNYISQSMLERLRNYDNLGGVEQPIRVLVPE